MIYSQNDEQTHILDALTGKSGSFLDIGAFDGRDGSNTYALAQQGWRGVLVEPSCHAFSDMLKLHGKNDKLSLVHALVGIDRKLPPFWNCTDALSTTEPANYLHWRNEVKFDAPYQMPQLTIRDLLDSFPDITKNLHFVSIDTEGTSAEIFETFPFDWVKPKVMCVEYDRYFERVKKHSIDLGYEIIYRSAENLVLVDPNQ